MFYFVSKLVWWLTTPLHAVLLGLLMGVIALWLGKQRLGRRIVTGVITLVILVWLIPLPEAALMTLEQWHAPAAAMNKAPDGIIVIGGAQDVELTALYGRPQFNDRAETVSEFVVLAHKYPSAKLVASGGAVKGISEADVVRMFAEQHGIDPARLLLEGRSRNTHENAVFAKELAQPQPDETWLLVTSAFHTPRAAAVFRKAGWSVVPYPVDYLLPTTLPYLEESLHRKFTYLGTALHEWIGLAVYWSHRTHLDIMPQVEAPSAARRCLRASALRPRA